MKFRNVDILYCNCPWRIQRTCQLGAALHACGADTSEAKVVKKRKLIAILGDSMHQMFDYMRFILYRVKVMPFLLVKKTYTPLASPGLRSGC